MPGTGSSRKWTRPRGFTLAELVVGLAIGAIIIVGTAVIMRQLVVGAAESMDDTIARVEVQMAGFWINEDAVQAQSISQSDTETGFLRTTLEWTEWDGDRIQVVYDVEVMVDERGRDLWRLTRHRLVGDDDMGTTIVAEHLARANNTRLEWLESDGKLELTVTAWVDRSEASGTYAVYPRAIKRAT